MALGSERATVLSFEDSAPSCLPSNDPAADDTKGACCFSFDARPALRILPLYLVLLIALFVIAPQVLHPDADLPRPLMNQGWFWLSAVNNLKDCWVSQSCGSEPLTFEQLCSRVVNASPIRSMISTGGMGYERSP
jgi:hypothetical protein